MTQPRAPEPAVVEWGAQPRRGRRLGRLLDGRWRDPRVARVLAGLAGVALFGSLVGEWQVTTLPFREAVEPGDRQQAVYLTAVNTWGGVWAAGVVAVGSCTVLTLLGLPALRRAARSVGLAIAGALLAVLVAVSVDLSRESLLYPLYGVVPAGDQRLEVTLGRGHHAAYLGLALVAAALWWARPARAAPDGTAVPEGTAVLEGGAGSWSRPGGAAPQPAPPRYGGPADLTVTRAEPFSHLGDEHRWR